jgi:hypothetical protein
MWPRPRGRLGTGRRSGPRSLGTRATPIITFFSCLLHYTLYFGVALSFFGVSLWRVRGRHLVDAQNQGIGQQIIGSNPQDQTFTPHLNSPLMETVDDGCSYLNQRVGFSGRVFPEYAALHL